MKEGKFRGKSLTTGQWVHGGYYNMDDCRKGNRRHIIVTENTGTTAQTEHEPIDINTLGSYTGFQDIYEDYVVTKEYMFVSEKTRFEFKGIVKYYECAYWIDNGKSAIPLFSEADIVKKLGNIHDNPELMKGE